MSYIDSPGLSYSRIKSLLRTGDREESVGLKVGSVVDSILTGEALDVLIYKDFNLKPQQQKFIEEVYKLANNNPDSLTFQEAFNNIGVKKGNINDFVVIFDNSEYYQYLQDVNSGKTVLAQSDYDRALQTVDNIQKSKYNIYFTNGKLQYELYGSIGKIKLDVLFTEDDGSLTPIDLKTTGDYAANFHSSYLKYRYDIQSVWYTKVLQELYPNTKINPFRFLVASTNKNDIYEFVDDLDHTQTLADINTAVNIYQYCIHNSLEVNRLAYLNHKYDGSIPLSEFI